MLETVLGYVDSFVLPFVGRVYADYITAVVIIAAFFVAAKAVNFIIKRFVLHVSTKTKSELDDLLVDAISLPLVMGIVVAGVFVALQGLPELSEYALYINGGFTVFYILFGALVAIRVINAIVRWYAIEVATRTHTKMDEQYLPTIKRVVSGIILLLALVWILASFGIEITAIVAAMGIGGIAIALALQDTLKELFAGAHVMMDRPIKLGDFIELDSGDRGTVIDIGWRSTKIKTFTRNYVIIPNSKLAASKLINYDKPKQEIGFGVECGVSYHEDLDRVEKVTVEVARSVLKKLGTGAKGFEPLVRFKEFGDSNINFKVIFRVSKFADQYVLRHEFIKALKKRFDKEGIEISWPVSKVYMHKGRGK